MKWGLCPCVFVYACFVWSHVSLVIIFVNLLLLSNGVLKHALENAETKLSQLKPQLYSSYLVTLILGSLLQYCYNQ
jgi:hypothetical protein